MPKLNVLFLCTGNSCRSHMAEGWARHLKGDRIEAFSAGIEKHGMNPHAVRVMAEAGVDISRQLSKPPADLGPIEFDYVVTVCGHADEHCPVFPTKTRVCMSASRIRPRSPGTCPTARRSWPSIAACGSRSGSSSKPCWRA